MTVVVDACLAIKWSVEEEFTEQALELWDVWQMRNELLVAPPFFRAEITNVLHRKVRQAEMDPLDASDILEVLLPTVATEELDGMYERAFSLALALDQKSAYDTAYLALAESLSCEMWTADRRFVRAAGTKFPQVRWIGEHT
jgi:predicted nucleic acid-binding protein